MRKIPFRATLLLLLVLFITAWNILRLWTSLAWRAALVHFAGGQMLTGVTLSAAAWCLVGIISAWGILRGKSWAAKMLVGAACVYSIWYWVERLTWQNPRQNWVFAVIVNLILIVFILLTKKSLSREAYE